MGSVDVVFLNIKNNFFQIEDGHSFLISKQENGLDIENCVYLALATTRKM